MKKIKDRNNAEAAMHELALAANNRRKLIARLDAEKLAAERKYAADIEVCTQFIAEAEAALEAWAVANPEEFPKKKKSIKFASGTIGFRDGKPKLELASKTWSWEKALDAVQRFLPNFIRSAPEIDKAAIIAQANELEPALRTCGLKVEQGEKFFAKPELTDTEVQ